MLLKFLEVNYVLITWEISKLNGLEDLFLRIYLVTLLEDPILFLIMARKKLLYSQSVRNLKAPLLVWTIQNDEVYQQVKNECDNVIFENLDL